MNKSKNTAIVREIMILYMTERSLYLILYGIRREKIRINVAIIKIYGNPIETAKRYVEHIIVAKSESKNTFEFPLIIIVLFHY